MLVEKNQLNGQDAAFYSKPGKKLMTPERYQRFKTVLQSKQTDLTVVMENIHKPRNFAAIIRTAEAVGIHTVHAITETTGPVSQHHHTAAGANKWVQTQSYTTSEQALSQIKQQGMQLVIADVGPDAIDYQQLDYRQPTALLMGSELYGVSDTARTMADAVVTIPMLGLVESLNVSVACALILFEAAGQRRQAGLYERRLLPEDEYQRTLFEWCYPTIADHCQRENKPYPKLDEEGYLITNQCV